MKRMKHWILVGTLGTALLVGGIASAAGSAPLWYTNYLQGKTTPAGQYSSAPRTSGSANETVPGRSNYSSLVTQTESQPAESVWTEHLQGLTAEEEQLLILLNQSRVKRGLPVLAMNEEVVKLARLKARDMADNKYFSHTSPTYGKAIDMVRRAGIAHRIVGENIAITSSASRANALFMGSSVHRATMLNPGYTQVGIGMYRAANGSLYVAEIFIGTR